MDRHDQAESASMRAKWSGKTRRSDSFLGSTRRLILAGAVVFILGAGEGAAVALFFAQKYVAAKETLSWTTFAAMLVTVSIWLRRAV